MFNVIKIKIMITIQPKVRKRTLTKINLADSAKGQKLALYPIQMYVNDRGKVYYISTDFVTTNPNHQGCVFTDRDKTSFQNQRMTDALYDIYNRCREYAEAHAGYPVDAIKENLRRIIKGQKEEESLQGLKGLVQEFAHAANHTDKTAHGYMETWRKIERFDEYATLETIDEDWLNRWRDWMKETTDVNSYAIHLRNLRAVFNYARKKKKITNNYPFEDFKIGQKRTYHRVLTIDEIARLRDHCCEDWQDIYRDMFMLMLYLGGIDLTDLVLVKRTHDRLVFVRNKNRNRESPIEVSLPILPQAEEIIKKYKGKSRLLRVCEHQTVDGFRASFNDGIKTIGDTEYKMDRLGKMRKVEYHPFFPDITSKTARRTFVSLATKMGVQERLLGMILGHAWSASNTTQIYEYFTQEDADNALKKVADYISEYKK